MPHPQLEDLKAAMRRAGVDATLVYVPPSRLDLGFVTIPSLSDDGFGKRTFFWQTLLPLYPCCGLTNGDIARRLKAMNLKALDRSAECNYRYKWATPLEDPDTAGVLLLRGCFSTVFCKISVLGAMGWRTRLPVANLRETCPRAAEYRSPWHPSSVVLKQSLRVLSELYWMPPTQGLFITNVPDCDDWPDPIPVPSVWPPL